MSITRIMEMLLTPRSISLRCVCVCVCAIILLFFSLFYPFRFSEINADRLLRSEVQRIMLSEFLMNSIVREFRKTIAVKEKNRTSVLKNSFIVLLNFPL